MRDAAKYGKAEEKADSSAEGRQEKEATIIHDHFCGRQAKAREKADHH